MGSTINIVLVADGRNKRSNQIDPLASVDDSGGGPSDLGGDRADLGIFDDDEDDHVTSPSSRGRHSLPHHTSQSGIVLGQILVTKYIPLWFGSYFQ